MHTNESRKGHRDDQPHRSLPELGQVMASLEVVVMGAFEPVLGALRVGVGTGDPRWVPGVRSWLRFFEDCNRKEPLAWMTVSRW